MAVSSATIPAELDISVGDTFESYAELRERIDKYKKAACTDLYIWDSQTIANATKHGVKIPIKNEIKYYYIKFACVHGGKEFKGRGCGKRETRLITTSNENENDKNEMAEVESTQPETKTDSAQFSGKMTLRKLAQQLYPSSSEKSEDEDCPNDRFVEMLHEMHNDGILLPLVQQGVDVERNPLMVMNSGSVHSVDIEKFAKEFPTFHKQLTSRRKRLGSFGYLSKFLRTHYHESLHSVSSTCLSQIEYVQLAVQNLISDN